jgi:ribose/xylose/arabinose/galactoside ABC-type transport system permease subunit
MEANAQLTGSQATSPARASSPIVAFFAGVGLLGLLLSEQILTGWIALGERANISRRDINPLEWAVIVVGLLIAAAALRTAWGLLQGERAGLAWARWVSFGTALAGLTLAYGSVLPSVIKSITNSSNVYPLAQNQLIFQVIIGIVLLVTGRLVYREVTRNAEGLTPGKYVNVQLAKSPSAGAIMGFLAIFFSFSIATPLFLEQPSIASYLTNVSLFGIIAVGVTMLMISGEFDLSVGSIFGVTSMSFMLFMTEGLPFIGVDPMPPLVAAFFALIIAGILGLTNGVIRVRTGIPSFIVTLSTQYIFRAFTLVVIGGGRILRYRDYYQEFPQVYLNRQLLVGLAVAALLMLAFLTFRTLPPVLRNFQERWANRNNNGDFGTLQALVGTGVLVLLLVIVIGVGVWLTFVASYHIQRADTLLQVGFFDIMNGRWEFSGREVTGGWFQGIDIDTAANFRNSIIWWLFFSVFFHIVMTRTRYGNSVFAVGGNIGAARAQGINVNRVKIMSFMLTAVLTGIAAVYETTRNPGVDPLKGQFYELDVIAMTVIGGALLSGGYGSIIGTILGALIYGMMQTGLVLVGMESRMFAGVVGTIILIAVVLNTYVRRIPTN